MRGMASISARFAKSFMANGIERSRNRLSRRVALSAKALGMTRAPVADATRCVHLYRVMRQGRQSGVRKEAPCASPRPRHPSRPVPATEKRVVGQGLFGGSAARTFGADGPARLFRR